MAGKWNRGHLSRFWTPYDYKNLNYVKQPLMDSEIEEWKRKGYDYVKSFSGSMYNNSNEIPHWVNRFDKMFDLNNMTYNFYKMSQLEIMPEHVDHFQTYMRLFNVEYKNIRRVLIMLEDWKPGHYLEIDGVGVVNWIAGDYFIWDSDVRHAAANIGTEDRYTLQITGTEIRNEDVYRKVHWYNFPDLEPKKESLYSPEMFVMKRDMNKQTPYYVYMFNQHLKDLAQINHNSDTVTYLNNVGVEIYLYEPLCSYIEGAKPFYAPYGTIHTLMFYSEFHYDQVSDTSKIRSEELDSIEEYIDRNKLTNVTVHTCDYNIEKYYPHYSQKMKLKCNDIFLAHFDVTEFEPLLDTDVTSNFSKKFISMNWRYAPHRQLIASYLANFSDTYLTWCFKSDLAHISSEPWYNIPDWRKKNLDYYRKVTKGLGVLNAKAPWTLDLNIKEATIINHNYFKSFFPNGSIFEHKTDQQNTNRDRLKTVYSDIFCDIVTESRFAQPTANFSEKAYRPMFYKKPFILVAPPNTLGYMRTEGFETFGDFWDESYDSMEDHESRLFAIFKLIDQINSMPIEQLKEMYIKMTPILEHNRNLLLKKCPPRP